jgi:hypothetical protein
MVRREGEKLPPHLAHFDLHLSAVLESPVAIMRALSFLVGLCAIVDGFRVQPCVQPCARSRHVSRGGAPPRAQLEAERESPPELFGPWEVRSSFSGAEEGWVELDEGGQIACSPKLGSGKEWYAERRGSSWRIHMTLLDKLGRPYLWQGDTRPDEYREVAIEGKVYTPGRAEGVLGQKASEAVEKAEFRGWKLD